MPTLFEVTDVDRRIYEEEICNFLPDKIIDIHTHVWRDSDKIHSPDDFKRIVSWPMRVAKDNSIEDLIESYHLMFPGKSVIPLMFSSLGVADDAERMNSYVSECAKAKGFPALLWARPEWTGEEVESKIIRGGFIGVKVYLSFAPAYIPTNEIRIFDFLPPHQLHVLNRSARIVMLHIPRDGRLRDPVNIEQMLEIERNFPRIKLIIAHVGRAYCNEDVGDAFERLKQTQNMIFDTSANTNDQVFEKLLAIFGPDRVAFGSDLPITRMRMRRICEGGRYINIVPKGLYGDVSGDPNMREVDGPEAKSLTTFMYEEIRAIKAACTRRGIDRSGIEAIFYGTAHHILKGSTIL